MNYTLEDSIEFEREKDEWERQKRLHDLKDLTFSEQEILGSQSASTLRLVNRLIQLGQEIRMSDDLSHTLCEVAETLQCRIRKGEEDAMAFVMASMHGLSIAEMHQMNRDGVEWCMGVLHAIMECGIETARHPNAIVQSVGTKAEVGGKQLIGLEYQIVDNGCCIGKIAMHRDLDGACGWVSTARQKVAEWHRPLSA